MFFNNGLDYMIMQSQEDADKIIDTIEKYYKQGINVAAIDFFKTCNINKKDVLPADLNRIDQTLKKFCFRH